MYEFTLAFDPTQISKLAAHYQYVDDAAPIAAGTRIRNGEYNRANLVEIFEWKTGGRGRSRLTKNTDAEIADALALATTAKTDRAALAVLMGLNGIQVPVASAVLTAIYPDRFTIVDFRALDALQVHHANITIDFYLRYLNECRRLARLHEVSIRTLDRALWQWSKESSRNKP